MVLKNYNDLSLKIKGDVKVIYKGEKGKRKLTQGLYTKNKYVFTDIKKGNERESMIGRKMEMIYNQERGSRKKEEEKSDHKNFREIPHIEVKSHLDETPNIYNQQGISNENPKKNELNSDSKYINVNEKKIRVSGFRKDTSTNRKRKLTSNRKLSSLSKIVRDKRSKEKTYRSYKSNLKNKLGDQTKEKRKERDSLGKRSESKRNSRSRLYAPTGQVSKTNIYKKVGPEFNFPKSEIEFEGKNVQNSIYLKSEEIKPDEGTTISGKTENSLACQENISKRLQISQSPEHNISDRRGRQSTKNGEQENVYFETEKNDLEYAKSEDLGKEGRSKGIGGQAIRKDDRGLGDLTSLEEKGEVSNKKTMKLSQSDAGNWKGMVKVKFTGARSGDFDINK
jgi:hypothetical protein